MRPCLISSLAVFALFAFASDGPVLCQPVAPPATPPAPPVVAPIAAPAAVAPLEVTAKSDDGAAKALLAKGKDAGGRDTLTVCDFPNTDIRDILSSVADLFELNLVMPEALQGKTTIKLRDVTWRQIFKNVLEPVGFMYVEDGNIIKIVSKESLNEEPATTEVFLINYARAVDILPTITTLVDPAKGGRIVVDTRSNSLIITERPSRFNHIRPIIEQLDRATDQVMIETKFVEVTNRDVKNIGVNWASLQNYSVSVGPGPNGLGTFERTRTQTTTGGVNSNNTNAINNVNGTNASNVTNVTNGQTSGSTNSSTVTSVNGLPTSTAITGINGALTNGTTVTNINGTSGTSANTTNNALTFLNDVVNGGTTTRAVQAVFNADEFKLVLSALQTQNDVKIVSNPTIVTLNNTEATINVGESDPLPNYTFNPQTGTQEVSGFSYKDIGILLRVTPQVNSRGFIKLTLAPEVSQKNGTLSFGAAQLPIIATRKATTQVSLKDGFTMGIGGLLSSSNVKGVSKIPVLGSIPLLGRLFRSDSKDYQVTNLIIFITAKTISAEGATLEQVFDSSRVRQLELTKADLPGYRDGTSPLLAEKPAGNK